MQVFEWMKSLSRRLTRPSRRRSLCHFGSEQLESKTLLSAVFLVDTTADGADANPGDGVAETALGQTTLRAAVQEAASTPDFGVIILPGGEYSLTILDDIATAPGGLTGEAASVTTPGGDPGATAATGDLGLNGFLAVVGFGVDLTTINGTAIGSIFSVNNDSLLLLTGVTLISGPNDAAISLGEDSVALLVDVGLLVGDELQVGDEFQRISLGVLVGPTTWPVLNSDEEPSDVPINSIPAPTNAVVSASPRVPGGYEYGYQQWVASPPVSVVTDPHPALMAMSARLDATMGIMNPSPPGSGRIAGRSVDVHAIDESGGAGAASAETATRPDQSAPASEITLTAGTGPATNATNATNRTTATNATNATRSPAQPAHSPGAIHSPAAASDNKAGTRTPDADTTQTTQRRRDVVNTLFQTPNGDRSAGQQTAGAGSPVPLTDPGSAGVTDLPERTLLPMLLPTERVDSATDDSSAQSAAAPRPAAPPLPEPAVRVSDADKPQAAVPLIVSGLLLSVVHPSSWQRTLKRISRWTKRISQAG